MTAAASVRRRSALFMPASNPRAIAKARELACDVVILDLEDAVAPNAKLAARGAAVAVEGFGAREWAIRLNALDTPWGLDDAAAVSQSRAQAAVLPKVGCVDDLAAARAALGEHGPPIWAMIETCGAILQLPAIVAAAAATRTELLIAGTNDLAKEMRCRPGTDRAPLVPALATIVTAARAANLAVLDGVCNALHAPERLAAECAQGAMLGFDGKTLIHPSQIDIANRAFAPAVEEIAWAQEVIAAFDSPANADRGAIQLGGAMVERLHLDEARRIVRWAAA
ncbi:MULTISPECIES: CoA ester lyase [unclassified Sphingomonas]|nr:MULTISPECIES: CoA ester lyase [unclassified Sphingomonas]